MIKNSRLRKNPQWDEQHIQLHTVNNRMWIRLTTPILRHFGDQINRRLPLKTSVYRNPAHTDQLLRSTSNRPDVSLGKMQLSTLCTRKNTHRISSDIVKEHERNSPFKLLYRKGVIQWIFHQNLCMIMMSPRPAIRRVQMIIAKLREVS